MTPRFLTQRPPAKSLLALLFLALLLLPAAPVRAQEAAYSRQELAQLLAPIALYPDPLLAQILMAATYPLEVIEADRWLRRNPGLSGTSLDGALLLKEWDPSVEALCHFPDILALMSEHIGETTSLGNAFLAQQGAVMDMVQQLRAKAYAEGTLRSDARQRVIVENGVIRIEPVDPQVVYVPYYDPQVVYGAWWYPAYPPYYWGPPGVYLGIGIGYWPPFYFSFVYGSWCYFDWPRRIIFIDVRHRPHYVPRDRWHEREGRWEHSPVHRRGVAYRDRETARKFGQAPRQREDFRRDVRGYPEAPPPRERVPSREERGALERNRERERQTMQQRNAPPVRVAPERQERERQPQAVTPRQLRERQLQQGQQRERQLQQERQRQRPTPEVPRAVTPRQQRERQLQQEQRQRLEREPQQRVRDNVFNRVDEGRREGLSGERGRQSRQQFERSGPRRENGERPERERFDRRR